MILLFMYAIICLYFVSIIGTDQIHNDLIANLWHNDLDSDSHNLNYGHNYGKIEKITETSIKPYKTIKSEPKLDQESEEFPKNYLQTVKIEPKCEQNDYEQRKNIVKIKPKTEFDQFFDKKLEHNSFQESDQNYSSSAQEHLDQSDQQNQSPNNASDQSASLADLDHTDQDLKSNDDKQTKLMMIQQFDEYKQELKRNKKFDYRQRSRIDSEIAQKIGTTRWNIYKWRRQLGIKQMPTPVDEHTKLALIDQFNKMMKERRPENAYQNNQHGKIALEIARELGTSRDNIYQWKRDLGKTQKPNKQYVDDYDDKTKLALIEKFDKIKRQLKSNNMFDSRHRVKIEGKIANKLGIYRSKIIQWKSEIGKKQSQPMKETKLSLIKKFDKIKNEYKQKNMYENKQRANIECGIAKELGTNRDQIYKWKRQLVSERKLFTSEQKREIIEQFDKLKEQFSRKFKTNLTKQIEEKLARKFDISAQSIRNWKKEFGLIRAKKHKYTDSEKLEIIAKFDNIKRNNSALSDQQIVKTFGIKMPTIKQWRRKLGIVTK